MSIKEDIQTMELMSYVPAVENRLSGSETLEVIIPDKYPDASEIIFLSGNPYLKGKDETGSVALQTVYELSALVRAEDGTVFPVSTEIPVTIRSSLSKGENGCCHAELYSLSRDAHIVNSRKLAFSCEVGANITVWSPRESHFLTGESDKLIVKKSEQTLLRRRTAISESFFITDELPLPAGKPKAVHIVSKNYRWKSEETRLTSEKLIARAVVSVELGYLSEDLEWNLAEFELPFTRVFDLPSVDEESRYSCRFQKGKITVLPQTREESEALSITIAAEAQIVCYEKETVYLFEDLFSLTSSVKPEYDSILLPVELLKEEGRVSHEETVEFPKDPEEISAFSIMLSPPTAYFTDKDRIHAEVTAHADFLYRSGGILCHLEKNFPIEWESGVEGTLCSVSAAVATARYTLPAMRKSEIDLTLDFLLSGERTCELRAVSDLVEEQAETVALPSYLYIPASYETDLFSIGKKYHASPDDIAEVNGLAPENDVPRGTPLLIPVTKGKS